MCRWWKWTPVEDLVSPSESSCKWFSATVWNAAKSIAGSTKNTWQFVSKFSRAEKPSRMDFLGHSPKLLECDMLQAHGSKWPVTEMTDKTMEDERCPVTYVILWKQDICGWSLMSHGKSYCVFFKWTFTILILEKVIDMLASKHGKNLMPNFACLVFLFQFQQNTAKKS